MPNLKVTELDKIGTISDMDSFESPLNAFSDSINASFRDGGVWNDCNRKELLSLPDNKQVIYAFRKQTRLYLFTSDSVYFYSNSAYTKITLPATLTGINQYSVCACGNNIIVVGRQFRPFYIEDSSVNAAFLPSWNANDRMTSVTCFDSFVIGVGVYMNGAEYKTRVVWSDVAKDNMVPQSWDFTSTTNLAGYNDISDINGPIFRAVTLSNAVAIYAADSVTLMQGGAGRALVFRFTKILNKEVAILNPNCVVNTPNGHVVITSDDIIIHNGTTTLTLIEGRIKKQLFNQVRTKDTNAVQLVYVADRKEVMVCYQREFNGIINKAAVLNLETGSWSFQDLPKCTFLYFTTAPDKSSDIINDFPGTINASSRLINGTGKNFKNETLLCFSETKIIVLNENDDGSTNQPFRIEKTYIDFEELQIPHDVIKQITSVKPQISGPDGTQINVYIGSSNTPYDSVKWSAPQIFTINTSQTKVDFRVDGRYLAIKFESFSQSDFVIRGYVIEVNQRGKR